MKPPYFRSSEVHSSLREPSSAPPTATLALPHEDRTGNSSLSVEFHDTPPALTARALHFPVPTTAVNPVATGKATILPATVLYDRLVRFLSASINRQERASFTNRPPVFTSRCRKLVRGGCRSSSAAPEDSTATSTPGAVFGSAPPLPTG